MMQERTLSDPQAWLVDLDGTLYQALPVKLAMAAELALFGWGAIDVLRRFRHQHEELRNSSGNNDGGEDPYGEQIRRTAEASGIAAEIVRARVGEWMHRRPGKWLRLFRRRRLLAEIEAFRRRGGKTALVSDYPATEKLRGLGAVELFDIVVANGEPGGPRRLKPDPGGYLLAARRLGVAPDVCLVIGDRDDADGEAARVAGMAFRRVR